MSFSKLASYNLLSFPNEATGDMKAVFTLNAMEFVRAQMDPLYPIVVVGLGRAGKSTLLNKLIQFLTGGTYEEIFKTSDAPDPCTKGMSLCVVPRAESGNWLLIDAEGVDNVERGTLGLILALSCTISPLVVYVDTQNFNDRAVSTISRVALERFIEFSGDAKWPDLSIVINQSPLKVTDEQVAKLLNDKINPTPDTENAVAIRAFGSPTLAFLPLCANPADEGTLFDVKAKQVCKQITARAKPIVDEDVVVSGAVFAMMLESTVDSMNTRTENGRVSIKPATGASEMVAALLDGIRAASFDEFMKRVPSIDAVDGRNGETLKATVNEATAASLTMFLENSKPVAMYATIVSTHESELRTQVDDFVRMLYAQQAHMNSFDPAKHTTESTSGNEGDYVVTRARDVDYRYNGDKVEGDWKELSRNQIVHHHDSGGDDGCIVM